MILSVIITNSDLQILWKRYYDGRDQDERKEWEQLVYDSVTLEDAKAEVFQLQMISQNGQEVFLVYTGMNDIYLFVAGVDECDELTTSSVLSNVIEFLKANCASKTKEVTAASVGDHYEQLCFALDAMISNSGVVDMLDLSVASNLTAFKLPKGRTPRQAGSTAKLSMPPSKAETLEEIRLRYREEYMDNVMVGSAR
eukprot:TRINITY_DN3524_c0_g1_i1.p1 TRINITY_DN3524_c0_g1~~TRINITY_DN3524_c0_g1_i1.p1  ORF type:complete len:197 (-),score=68.00 TRINITY_DN3524_c0_g1_i1:81-671(-)